MNELDNTIKLINKERKANKGNWWTYFGVFQGKSFKIKAFNTWVQILEFEHETSRRSSTMDLKVKDFNEYLATNLESATDSSQWVQQLN